MRQPVRIILLLVGVILLSSISSAAIAAPIKYGAVIHPTEEKPAPWTKPFTSGFLLSHQSAEGGVFNGNQLPQTNAEEHYEYSDHGCKAAKKEYHRQALEQTCCTAVWYQLRLALQIIYPFHTHW